MFRLIIILFCLVLTQWITSLAQSVLSPENFSQFLYPGAKPDPVAIKFLDQKILTDFPHAKPLKLTSLVTDIAWQKVVAYYTILTGIPFRQVGSHFFFTFTYRNGIPVDYIEVCPIEILRSSTDFWPARINLVLLSFPLQGVAHPPQPASTTFRPLIGRLWYPGTVRDDLATLKMDELGSDAQVVVMVTDDAFEKVYSFFRRNYGRIYIVNGRRGDIMERDFEFDASNALATRKKGKELHVRVDENPMLVDREGNSEYLQGKCLIQYILWPVEIQALP